MTEEQVQHRTTSAVRLRVVLGDHRVDLAVPGEVPLVDLLPAVLPQFGAEVVEQGAEHEGWVLQRLGEAPLDEDRTAAQLALRDGDTVYLRARAEQLAPVDYDDVVAGVGEQVRGHAGSWTPRGTRRLLRIAATTLLLLGVPLLLGGGANVWVLLVAVAATAALLTASSLVARGIADAWVATALAGVATCYAATSGVLLALVAAPSAALSVALTCGAAAAVAVLVLGLTLLGDAALLFTGAVVAAAGVGVLGVLGALTGMTLVAAAAVTLVVTLIAGIFVPSAAFRLSGLQLPLLPTDADELTEDIEPVPHHLVVDRGAITIGYTTALHLGIGLAQIPLMIIVAVSGGWNLVFVLVVALLQLVRARHPAGSLARWAIMIPAAAGVVAGLLALTAGSEVSGRLLAWLAVLASGIGVFALADTLPGRRLRPYWGRGVDILESLSAVAVLPLMLQVLGVFALMRGLGG